MMVYLTMAPPKAWFRIQGIERMKNTLYPGVAIGRRLSMAAAPIMRGLVLLALMIAINDPLHKRYWNSGRVDFPENFLPKICSKLMWSQYQFVGSQIKIPAGDLALRAKDPSDYRIAWFECRRM